MTAKHTPGPWSGVCHSIEDGGEGYFEIEARALGYRNNVGDFARPFVITSCANEADVRLVVAAPLMLEALKELRAYLAGSNPTRAHMLMDEAIAEAESEQ